VPHGAALVAQRQPAAQAQVALVRVVEPGGGDGVAPAAEGAAGLGVKGGVRRCTRERPPLRPCRCADGFDDAVARTSAAGGLREFGLE
jgi:hypothetical protein